MRIYADIYKALSDETRLTILAMLLIHGELCVCDLEGGLSISQSKASRHLRYLKNAGILVDRRDGVWVYYKVDTKNGTAAGEILRSNKKLLKTFPEEEVKRKFNTWLTEKKNSLCNL